MSAGVASIYSKEQHRRTVTGRTITGDQTDLEINPGDSPAIFFKPGSGETQSALLPHAATCPGLRLAVYGIGSDIAANNVTIKDRGSERIDLADKVLAKDNSVLFVESTGEQWVSLHEDLS